MSEKNKDSVEDTKEILTEVTSIAKEEEKTGQKINAPTREELVAHAGMNIIRGKKHIATLLNKMGKGAVRRAVLAGLDLPMEEVPVKLISEDEKLLFATIQNVIQSRFIITQNHISEEINKQRKAKEEKECDISQSEQVGSTQKTEKSTSP